MTEERRLVSHTNEFQCGLCRDWMLPEYLEGHCASEGRTFLPQPATEPAMTGRCARCGKERALAPDGTCWTCAVEYRDEIIDEERALPQPATEPFPGLCDNPKPHGPHQRSETEACPGIPQPATEPALACARYWGSDGTLCSTHNGRFASPDAMRCDRRLAALPQPATEPALDEIMALVWKAESSAASTGRTGWYNRDIYDAIVARLAAQPSAEVERLRAHLRSTSRVAHSAMHHDQIDGTWEECQHEPCVGDRTALAGSDRHATKGGRE